MIIIIAVAVRQRRRSSLVETVLFAPNLVVLTKKGARSGRSWDDVPHYGGEPAGGKTGRPSGIHGNLLNTSWEYTEYMVFGNKVFCFKILLREF